MKQEEVDLLISHLDTFSEHLNDTLFEILTVIQKKDTKAKMKADLSLETSLSTEDNDVLTHQKYLKIFRSVISTQKVIKENCR